MSRYEYDPHSPLHFPPGLIPNRAKLPQDARRPGDRHAAYSGGMQDKTDPKGAPDYETSRGTPYAQMSSSRKALFILKLAVCILTFGMAFPNVMSD